MMNFLTDTAIRDAAPSVFALSPSPRVSERYAYLPTFPLIEELRERGLGVTSVKQGRKRAADGRIYAMHEVRMAKIDDSTALATRDLGGLTPQIIMLNSHDRSTSLTMFGGILRGLCHNGLYFGSIEAGGFKAMHYRMDMEKVLAGATAIVDRFDRMVEYSAAWAAIDLSLAQAEQFAKKAIEIRGTSMAVDPLQLLIPNRGEDEKRNLWNVFNTVQERLMHGTVQAQRANNSWRKLPAIKSLAVDSGLNRKLWTAASELAAEVRGISVAFA